MFENIEKVSMKSGAGIRCKFKVKAEKTNIFSCFWAEVLCMYPSSVGSYKGIPEGGTGHY